MASRIRKRRLSIFVVNVLVVVHFAVPVFADDRSLPGSDALRADPQLIVAIGSAAHASIMQIPNPSAKFGALAELADVLIRLNDPIGARAVLADARKIDSNSQADFRLQELITLSVLVGERDAAIDLVKKLPTVDGRVDGLGSVGAAEAKNGDIPAALKTVQAIEAEWQTTAHPPDPIKPTPAPAASYDRALYRIAAALVAKGARDEAFSITKKMSRGRAYIDALAMIAEAQCEAGERASSEITLAQIKTALNNPVRVAELFAICGNNSEAKTLIDAVPNGQSRSADFSRLVRVLAEHGDVAAARIFADAAGNKAGDLVLLGTAEEKTGDHAAAALTLRAARAAAIKPTSTRGDRDVVAISQIVIAQTQIGVLSDAVATALLVEPLNRMQFLTPIIAEATKRGDATNLRQAVDAALDTYKAVPAGMRPIIVSQKPPRLFDLLVKAGFADQARIIFAQMQTELKPDTLSGCQRVNALRVVKRMQLSLGDDKSASATTQQMAEEARKFKEDVAAAAKNTDPDSGEAKLAQFLNIILNALDKSEMDLKGALEQATALLGNNRAAIQAAEPLLFTALCFVPANLVADDLDAQIERHDFAGAMTTIQSVKGAKRDGFLFQLVMAEEGENRFRLAFNTANSIADAQTRIGALRHILMVMANSAPERTTSHSAMPGSSGPLPQSATTIATAANFDCSQAKSQLEVLICSDAELSSLDGQVGEAYYAVHSTVPKDGNAADQLLSEQREFLKKRTEICPIAGNPVRSEADTRRTIVCLKAFYTLRLNQLQQRLAGSGGGLRQQLEHEREEWQRERVQLEGTIAELREDRDRWRAQAEKLSLAIQNAPPPSGAVFATPRAGIRAVVGELRRCLGAVRGNPAYSTLLPHLTDLSSDPRFTATQLADDSTPSQADAQALQAYTAERVHCQDKWLAGIDQILRESASIRRQLMADTKVILLELVNRQTTWGAAAQRAQQLLQTDTGSRFPNSLVW